MAKVLITGISGQDGGYLAEQLLAAGDEVHGLVREQDRPAAGPAGPLLDGAEIHVADLTDTVGLSKLIHDLAPEEIARLHGPIGLHLGGRTPAEIAVAILAEIVAVRHGVAPVQKKPEAAVLADAGADRPDAG